VSENDRKQIFIAHDDGQVSIDIATVAKSFRDGSTLETRVATVIVDKIREEMKDSSYLVVPLMTLVSTFNTP